MSIKSKTHYIDDLKSYLDASTSAYHAVDASLELLEQAGFTRLSMSEVWPECLPQRLVVTNDQGSLLALVLPTGCELAKSGLQMIAAHTDSPCLKLKSNAFCDNQGYRQASIETYGGVLLSTWFDRELSLSGRVSVRANGKIESRLVDLKLPIAMVPSLAIHLNREANKGFELNPQKHCFPVLDVLDQQSQREIEDCILDSLNTDDTLLAMELGFYDCKPAGLWGVSEGFLASGRIDNLVSCHLALETSLAALEQSEAVAPHVLALFNHEEVGSQSHNGAGGQFLQQVLGRICPDAAIYAQMMSRSMLLSVDGAHACHPNFADKHDVDHAPTMNQGPVLKVNANQRYATNVRTQGYFQMLCEAKNLPYQTFTNRADMMCGSTVGPILAAQCAIQTLDLGVPMWAMHSARESCGVEDLYSLYQALVPMLTYDERFAQYDVAHKQ